MTPNALERCPVCGAEGSAGMQRDGTPYFLQAVTGISGDEPLLDHGDGVFLWAFICRRCRHLQFFTTTFDDVRHELDRRAGASDD